MVTMTDLHTAVEALAESISLVELGRDAESIFAGAT
jgi:hypothetical protein